MYQRLEAYRYDHLSRLTGVDRTGPPRQWVYGYDAVGNRLSEQLDQAVMHTAHNEKNQLLSQEAGGPLVVQGQVDEAATVTVNGQPARLLPGNVFEGTVTTTPGDNTVQVNATDGSGNVRSNVYEVTISGTPTTFTYDHNGNLLQKLEGTTTWEYDWTVENQLERVVKDGAEVATFRYDPLGRRAEKIAGGKTYRYLYDGMDILRETITNTVAGTAVATYRYTHGPAIDEPLSRENLTTGAVEYYHADGLGSIVKMTSSTGAVVQTRQYDAYGNLEAGADAPGFAYTGREWDPETGLYYYRARYYDAKAGRFISEDPIGLFGGMNLFAYVSDSPTRYRDPSGLAAGDPYSTAREAAVEALREVFCRSLREDREYAGRIYRNPDGSYSYTEARRGSQHRSDLGPWPSGTQNAGGYHTHGAANPGYPGEKFSPRDKRGSRAEFVPGYLATPSGRMLEFDPLAEIDPSSFGPPVTELPNVMPACDGGRCAVP